MTAADTGPLEDVPPVDPTPRPIKPNPGAVRVTKLWVIAVVAGLLAAGLTSAAAEWAGDRVRPDAVGDPSQGPQAGWVSQEQRETAEVRNAAVVYGLRGAIFGLILGVAGAAVRGSAPGAVVGGAAGALVGACAGVGVTLGVFPPLLRSLDPLAPDLLRPVLAHAANWGLIGLGVGLGLGLGLNDRTAGRAGSTARCAVGGFLGGAAGAALYQVLGALLMPLAQTSRPLATTVPARVAGHALFALVVVAMIVISATAKPRVRVPKAKADEV